MANFDGTQKADVINATSGADTISSGNGNDKVWAGDGNDTVDAGNGEDTVYAGAGDDTVDGGNGSDTLYGEAGNDTIYGGNGTDYIDGGADNDTLDGGNGNDTILGGDGDDTIIGGLGSDILTGGSGADRFVYLAANESSDSDLIMDFLHGTDKIDLTALLGTTDLVWGNTAPTAKGVWVSHTGSGSSAQTHVWADVNGDAVADLHIILKGNITLDANDFLGVSAAAVVDDGDATVTITGTAQEDSVLTANFADNDPDGAASGVTYQWQRDGADIDGATGSTYTLGDDDVGANITVVVSYTDGQGFSETIESDPTATVTAFDDGDATVTITGTAQEDSVLTANFADDDPDGAASGVTYQWQRDGADIDGATDSTYTLGDDDVGANITVVVSYTDGQGFSETIESDPTDTVTAFDDGDATVTITGTAQEDSVLTANFADDDPDGAASGVSYQWQRDGADIDGATGSTYTLGDDDVGANITVVVSYTDGQGFSETIESDPTDTVTAFDDGDATVTITGTAQEDSVLTANFADDDPDGAASGVSYQWQRDGADIDGATGSTYTLGDDDVGANITVVVSYTDGQGFSETIESDPTNTVTAFDDGDATVTITGTAQEDSVLTANFADDDPDGAASGVSYQWQRDGADIDGATGSTYTLGDDDVGANITVVVSYTDGQGFSETIESDPTDTVTAFDDGDATVTITGTAQEDSVLTANFADDDPDGAASGVSYQWQRDGADIDGATGSTYTLGDDDVGANITVVVSYTDGQGFSETIESDPTDTVTAFDDGDATVTITGTAQEDSVLTANFADDDPDGAASGVTYQWQRDGADIDGATGSTYTLGDDDVGSSITVVVSYTDGQGFSETIESDPTDTVTAFDDGDATVTITGTAQEDSVLTANFADDDPDGAASGVSYQWQRDGADIDGATGSTYTLGDDDVGANITVVVSYTDGQGFAETIESDPTDTVTAFDDGDATVTVTGTAQEDSVLTANFANNDPDGAASGVTYQWQRDGVNIGSATGSTYTLGDADVGKAITVEVSYTDGQGFSETIESDPTATVTAFDDGDATVTITGTAQEDSVLTANFANNDPDGAASGVTYQWQRDGVNIGSATGSTYTLGDADVGKAITVEVSYTDGQGFSETIESDPTATVTAFDDGDATVTITGTVQEDSVLTANFANNDPDGAASGVTYQWQRDGVNIGSATGSTYTLGDDDVGKAITVEVSYTDGQGFSEHIESAATAAVTGINDVPIVSGVSATATQLTFTISDPDNASLTLVNSPAAFATAFGNPTLAPGVNNLTPSQQGTALSGTLQISDGAGGTASVVGLYLGTGANNTGVTAPIAGSPNAMYGFGGNDSMTGGSAADFLIGGIGNDTINGGAGNDSILYTVGDGSDVVNGGDDTDTFAITGTSGTDSLAVTVSGGVITQVAGGNVTNVENFTLDMLGGNDTLSYASTAAAQGISVNLSTGAATGFTSAIAGVENVTGGAGADTLTGDGNANKLIGGDGVDTLSGGAGNDVLRGGNGNDSLTGGDGADQFRMQAADTGSDTIADYVDGTDKLGFLDIFGNTAGSASGEALNANDFASRASIAGILGTDDNKVVVISGEQTQTQITTGTIGGAANIYAIVFNSDTGKGEIWFDDNWANTGGRVKVATLDNVTTLSGVTNITEADIIAYSSATDPLVFDLGASGIDLTNVDNGVAFDINADGIADQVAWTTGDDGILALDLDGSGTIDSGSEIFTPSFAGGNHAGGLAALATLDGNADGVIDSADAAFADLRIWQDIDHDGISDEGELTTLADHGIVGINLNATPTDAEIDGQQLVAEGTFIFADGTSGTFAEVALDTELGVPADQILVGSADADTLTGGAGNDMLAGGGGNDFLYGGLGSDSFAFDEAGASNTDIIADYAYLEGDMIVLSEALSASFGNDPGRVRLEQSGNDLHLQVDTSGDGDWTDVATLAGVGTSDPVSIQIAGADSTLIHQDLMA